MNNLTVVDLFCGAGGLSFGFKRAGFKVLHAYDFSKSAVSTYAANFSVPVSQVDLLQKVSLPSADVVIGGPPCQGFSSAGLRKDGDSRNLLVGRFAELIVKLKPKAFVFENVEGFLTAEKGNKLFELITPLIARGYQIHIRKVNVANYGIPQHRKRVIVLGGLGFEPGFLEPTHSAFGAPGATRVTSHLPLTKTVGQALEGLLPATTDLPGNPQGHWYKPLMGIDLERASALLVGQTMRDLPEELQHESYRRRAHRRVMDGTPTEKRGGAPAGLRRLHPDQPSKSITSGARNEFLHPNEPRSLTLRECARLQTFPDDFVFKGNPKEQMQLIGNAVPPLFAQKIAEAVLDDLKFATTKVSEGKLLSFIPTLAEGYSPILKSVTETVYKTFKVYPYRQETLWP